MSNIRGRPTAVRTWIGACCMSWSIAIVWPGIASSGLTKLRSATSSMPESPCRCLE